MTDVELDSKNLADILKIFGAYFKDKKPNERETKLIKILEVMYDAEKEFEDSIEEDE